MTTASMTVKQAEKTLGEAAERQAREEEARRVLREDEQKQAQARQAEKQERRVARQREVIAALQSAREALAGALARVVLTAEEKRSIHASAMDAIASAFASTSTSTSGDFPVFFEPLDRAIAGEERRLAKLSRVST
jgi:hypothetical protein